MRRATGRASIRVYPRRLLPPAQRPVVLTLQPAVAAAQLAAVPVGGVSGGQPAAVAAQLAACVGASASPLVWKAKSTIFTFPLPCLLRHAGHCSVEGQEHHLHEALDGCRIRGGGQPGLLQVSDG